MKMKIKKEQRTLRQNNAMHQFFEEVEIIFEEHGIDIHQELPPVPIPYTKETIKEIWRAIQKRMFDKESTAELTTDEVNKVWEVFNRWTSGFGVHVPFPSEEELRMRQRLKEQ